MSLVQVRYTRTYTPDNAGKLPTWANPSFELSSEITDGVGQTVVPSAVICTVNSSGQLVGPDGVVGVLLYALDQTSTGGQVQPQGVVYQVREPGMAPWSLATLKSDQSPTDLATKSPAQPAVPSYGYALQAALNVETARAEASESASKINVLYNADPNWGPFYHQEILQIVGAGTANPMAGKMAISGLTAVLPFHLPASVYGGANADFWLLIGQTAASPTTPLWAQDTSQGLPVAAAGVSNFQKILLPPIQWEQEAGLSATSVPVTVPVSGTYVWQVVCVIQAAATTVNVGNSPNTLDISPDGTLIAVPNQLGNTVQFVSLGARPTWQVDGGLKDVAGNPMAWFPVAGSTIAVGAAPNQCKFSPDGTKVAVFNHTDKTVTFITVSTKTVSATSTALAATAAASGITWASDNGAVWCALSNGTIVPVSTAGVVGTAITVASGHGLVVRTSGSVGWVLDTTAGYAYPLSSITDTTCTVGAGTNLSALYNAPSIDPRDSSLWAVSSTGVIHVNTGGIVSTTALTGLTAPNCSAMTGDGLALWFSDFSGNNLVAFDTTALAQVYKTTETAIGSVAISAAQDDIAITHFQTSGNVKVWPGSKVTVGSNSFPAGQTPTVLVQGAQAA